MRLGSRQQSYVLDNIDRVQDLAYKLHVSAPSARYQLDGKECTRQITGLAVRGYIIKNNSGRYERKGEARRKPSGGRQPPSPDVIEHLIASLLAPVPPRRNRL